MAKAPEKVEITIDRISTGTLTVQIVGTSPLYFNSMSNKAKRTLLMPEVMSRKTRAERASDFKHRPVEEFRGSVYSQANGETYLEMPSPAFKGSMMTAALDLPNVRKKEIGRLVWVEGYRVPIWGVPFLKMDVVRSADMNKTPDVRTRAFLPEWCSEITLSFMQPNLTAKSIINLLAAGGLISGVGDFRQEKGKGSFGQFRLVESREDPDFVRITSGGGRAEQIQAMNEATPFDEETAEMLSWYSAEVINLGARKASNVILNEAEDEAESERPKPRKSAREVAA